MTRMWAGEQYIGHWDGYSVTRRRLWPNNYYLHSDATGRFTMLPSGLDADLQRPTSRSRATGDGLLITRCLGDTSCLEDFRANLGAVSAAADAIGIGARLDAIAATVARWRPCPNLGQATDAAWQAAVTATRAFIRDRRIARGRLPRRGRSRARPGARVDRPAAAERRRLPDRTAGRRRRPDPDAGAGAEHARAAPREPRPRRPRRRS